MDFTTLKSRVSELLGNDTAGMLTKIGNWLNFAQRDFAHSIEFESLMKTTTLASNAGAAGVGGQYFYGMPTDLDHIHSIVWQGQIPRSLDPLHIEDYYRDVPHIITANDYGEPTDYIISGGGQFFVYPVYDQSKTVYNFLVHYFKIPTDMSAGTDTPSFESEYHHDLIWGAYHWGQHYAEDPNLVQTAVQEYQNIIRRIRARETKKRRASRSMTSIQDIRTSDSTSWGR